MCLVFTKVQFTIACTGSTAWAMLMNLHQILNVKGVLNDFLAYKVLLQIYWNAKQSYGPLKQL